MCMLEFVIQTVQMAAILKFKMAAKLFIFQLGSHPKNFQNIFLYHCAKFHASFTK